MSLTACPQCGSSIQQTREDGRCVACGRLLPEELLPPVELKKALTDGERGAPDGSNLITLKCPFCNFDNKETARVCEQCRSKLNPFQAHMADLTPAGLLLGLLTIPVGIVAALIIGFIFSLIPPVALVQQLPRN